MVKNPSQVKNKVKRTTLYTKYKSEKKAAKRKLKKERVKEADVLGEEAPKMIPRTIENTRLQDDNRILPNDTEVLGDEKDDEFSEYYTAGKVSST
jgi:ribosome production factor 1